MPKGFPAPDRLNYDDIRHEVSVFVEEWGIDLTTPVNIDRIADVKLRLDVVPVPGLLRDRSIEGYLSTDRATIYVDEDRSIGEVRHRYRFTLAHEIGHWYLHEDLYVEAHKLGGSQPHFDFVNRISPKDWYFYEWQARAFAGLILVPQEALKAAVGAGIQVAAENGFPDLDPSVEAHRGYLVEYLSRQVFEVSSEVIQIRGAQDGLWPEIERGLPNPYWSRTAK